MTELNASTLAPRPRPREQTRAGRCRRIWLLMAALWIMNGFDLAMTITAHQQGLLYEQNPVAVVLLSRGSSAVALFKILSVGAGSAILLRYRRLQLVECTAWVLAAAYVAVSLRWMFCCQEYESIVLNRIQAAFGLDLLGALGGG